MKWNTWFWIYFAGFLISFVLPSFGYDWRYYGYEIIWEGLSLILQGKFDSTLFIICIMSIPNWIVLILLVLRWRLNTGQVQFKAKNWHLTLLVLTIITGLIYPIMWIYSNFNHAPIWGYYLWICSTTGMTYIHYEDYKQRLQQLDTNDLEKHLVE